jgi:hypothetical protein
LHSKNFEQTFDLIPIAMDRDEVPDFVRGWGKVVKSRKEPKDIWKFFADSINVGVDAIESSDPILVRFKTSRGAAEGEYFVSFSFSDFQ